MNINDIFWFDPKNPEDVEASPHGFVALGVYNGRLYTMDDQGVVKDYVAQTEVGSIASQDADNVAITGGSSVLNALSVLGMRMHSLTKSVGSADTAVVDIPTSGENSTWAKVVIRSRWSTNFNLCAHYEYPFISAVALTGGNAGIIERYKNQSGSAVWATTDFAVSRPSNHLIRVTYTPSADGTTITAFDIIGACGLPTIT